MFRAALLLLPFAAFAAPADDPPTRERAGAARTPATSRPAGDINARTVPCDLTAERGICLYNGARTLAAPGASLTVVPVESTVREASAAAPLAIVSTGGFVDDWQGETAYLVVSGRRYRLGGSRRRHALIDRVAVARTAPPTVTVTIEGEVVASHELSPAGLSALDGGASIDVSSQSNTRRDGLASTQFSIGVPLGGDRMETIATFDVEYTPAE